MEFCHIAPTVYVPLVGNHPRHLVLAHLIESNQVYVDAYLRLKEDNPKAVIIMDNGGFEAYKQGKEMYPSEKLIELAQKIKADYVVMSDYPKEDWNKTKEKAIEMSEQIHAAGLKTFYVPQSPLGDLDGLCASFRWAINNLGRSIDLIGVSILACPIALGLDENQYNKSVSGTYKMQRFLSRWKIMQELESRKIINHNSYGGWTDQLGKEIKNCFHFLGMTEGPQEINLVKDYFDLIASWDTSSAVWHGINHIRYDKSGTGLINGKFEKEVNFDAKFKVDSISDIMYNVNYIDQIVERLNKAAE